jgi:hypothetical protein
VTKVVFPPRVVFALVLLALASDVDIRASVHVGTTAGVQSDAPSTHCPDVAKLGLVPPLRPASKSPRPAVPVAKRKGRR